MKKILSLLIAGLLLTTSLVACGDDETTEEGGATKETVAQDYFEDINKTGRFEYDVNDEGDYELTGYTPYSVTEVDLVLPSEVNGRDIVGITAGFFKGSTKIKSITFPEGSKYEYIGDAVFSDCDLLTSITLPETITSIGKNIFDGCDNLKTVTLSSKITEIPVHAFANCKSLTAIDLSNVKTINDGAFTNCSALTNVTVSNDLEYATKDAFRGCTSLAYNKDGGVCYLGNAANKYVLLVTPETPANMGIKECVVNANTKVIADRAFLNCSKLEKITLSDSVKVINGTTFENCGKLTYNESENGLYLGTAANPYMVLIKLKMPNVEDFTLNKDTKIITATAFAEAKALEDISYGALAADWDKIIKADAWNHDIDVNVTFSDNTMITIEG